MKIKVKIFNCNYETYKKYYKDAIKRLYQKENKRINLEKIKVEIEELPGDTIQAQRSARKHSRTISIYENKKLKYIIGFSNTNFDEDKKKEVEEKGGKYVYGTDGYHANTYLCQGLNKVLEYYFDEKKENSKLKLYLYLLDTKQTYANNLTNLMTYRELATIGFKILNLDEITFKEYEKLGFSLSEHHDDIKYVSFNKFANDISYLSKKNSGNMPSYLKCIDEDYDIKMSNFEENEDNYQKKKYIYTFKTLSAEGYDSFFTMWTLMILAKKENKKLEFLFGSQLYHLSGGKENYKQSTGFTGPILSLIQKANLDINYETAEEILSEIDREKRQFEIAMQNNILRNQELFKNNIRKKGVLTKCYLCGCECEEILEAAHLWNITDIKAANSREIGDIINNKDMKDLLDPKNPHYKELFYKKYMLANSGDNGIWLCRNHHGFFDSNYYCFNSQTGKVIIKNCASKESRIMFSMITPNKELPKEILTTKTKLFLVKREENFNKRNSN